jgi:hypothetical protein
VASSYVGDFTFPHQIHETESSLLAKAKALLAGGLAEEVVFGAGHASIGRASDREQATMVVTDYGRRYGFDVEFQATYTLDMGYAMEKSATDIDIEKLMERLVADTRQLLTEHRPLLLGLATHLADAGELDAHQVAAIAAGHGVEARVRPEGYLVVHPYSEQLRPQPDQTVRSVGLGWVRRHPTGDGTGDTHARRPRRTGPRPGRRPAPASPLAGYAGPRETTQQVRGSRGPRTRRMVQEVGDRHGQREERPATVDEPFRSPTGPRATPRDLHRGPNRHAP